MSKLLTGMAALALLSISALPASAAERKSEGLRAHADQYEFSAHRRAYRYRHRVVRRYYAPRRYYARRYWGGPYYYGGYPYGGYYAAAPGFGVGIGPFGFGFGIGPRWW